MFLKKVRHLLPTLDSQWTWKEIYGERVQKNYRWTETRHFEMTLSQTSSPNAPHNDINSPETISSAYERRHVEIQPQRPTVDYGPSSAGCQYTDPTTSTVTIIITSQPTMTSTHQISYIEIRWHSKSLQILLRINIMLLFKLFLFLLHLQFSLSALFLE